MEGNSAGIFYFFVCFLRGHRVLLLHVDIPKGGHLFTPSSTTHFTEVYRFTPKSFVEKGIYGTFTKGFCSTSLLLIISIIY